MNSLIIPIYKNAENIPHLLDDLKILNKKINNLETVFVVDGSPDNSAELLMKLLPQAQLNAQVLLLSRNFGSFSAIRAGLAAAKGECFAVMAADLQEPPELIIDFFRALSQEPVDIVIGVRESRSDPILSRLASNIFWRWYKAMVIPEIPKGGVDVFGCNKLFRDHLLTLEESHSSLVALIFWMGFRRKEFTYTRQKRQHGKSAWTFKKKIIYLKDSIFSFTDLPIKILSWMGSIGIILSILIGISVMVAKMNHWIEVPGYTATILVIVFFAAINLLGLGIIGTYAWRTYENTKRRPSSLVMKKIIYTPDEK